ncbi:hypothetical protein AAG584_19185 [Vreelandella titanicae]|uniref:Uncharacterized protein n=1 Tax=Vreelandella titanicae TaxID=664683 RepID=A0AAP9NN05_9GAMM|nr:hypothetical protein [Halomonas titanicae]QKS24773.1 hypothetical protein FX987_02555 [Halomonas titanicae]SDJ23613.1 hypothetical protein SAMN04487867_12942 [Halomonas titanicae]
MKALAGITIISAALLAGCGASAEIAENANKVAAFSEDADQHKEQFAEAIDDLSRKKSCNMEAMLADGAGFSRVTGDSFYFIYCDSPGDITNRWYFDPANNKLERVKAAMR